MPCLGSQSLSNDILKIVTFYRIQAQILTFSQLYLNIFLFKNINKKHTTFYQYKWDLSIELFHKSNSKLSLHGKKHINGGLLFERFWFVPPKKGSFMLTLHCCRAAGFSFLQINEQAYFFPNCPLAHLTLWETSSPRINTVVSFAMQSGLVLCDAVFYNAFLLYFFVVFAVNDISLNRAAIGKKRIHQFHTRLFLGG